MTDQVFLEMTEARELLGQYRITQEKSGKETANQWLDLALKVTERKFGRGAGERVRGLMRKQWGNNE